jgi:hypothetical protein
VSAARHARIAAAGFVGGLAVGLVVWSTQVQRSRRELFSRSPMRRYYVNWETRPALRRRGQHLLRRMHAYLD